MDIYGANSPRPPPDIIEGEEVYEVEWILKHQISRQFISKMSTSSDPRSSTSSPNEDPLLTSSELSQLLLDQEMNFAVATAFSSSPLSTTLLRQYLFLSHNLE